MASNASRSVGASQTSLKSGGAAGTRVWQGGEKSSYWNLPQYSELCLMLQKAFTDAEKEEKVVKKLGNKKGFKEGKHGKKSTISVGSKVSGSLKLNDTTTLGVTPVNFDSKESTLSRANENFLLESLAEERKDQ